MAAQDFSSALPAPAPTMANPGYGKRNAPGQSPRTRRDFVHLPAREAALAALVDRLPEGAAMDAKTLATLSPVYGQAACRTALKRLSEAGHVRRITEHLAIDGGRRWVTRTYFSRTARSDAWWERFLGGGVETEADAADVRPTERPERPARPEGPARSRAYAALAALSRADLRLTLSAAECAALEPLAAEWLARGADEALLAAVLTAGLPDRVHCAGALVRRRLTDKMPPELPAPRQPLLRIMECALCGVPGRPDALPGGLCRDCRGEVPRPQSPGALAPDQVRRRIAELRAGVRAGSVPRKGRGELRDQPPTART
ncbi:hypothetical protein ACIHFE_15760 [Streptomyces sp. NPDC052396]|uniref:hypothetical protein n=1 Tax=Streptomyces sp. NPDC052396 TaxID=3365689 RepID=UPI0037D13237